MLVGRTSAASRTSCRSGPTSRRSASVPRPRSRGRCGCSRRAATRSARPTIPPASDPAQASWGASPRPSRISLRRGSVGRPASGRANGVSQPVHDTAVVPLGPVSDHGEGDHQEGREQSSSDKPPPPHASGCYRPSREKGPRFRGPSLIAAVRPAAAEHRKEFLAATRRSRRLRNLASLPASRSRYSRMLTPRRHAACATDQPAASDRAQASSEHRLGRKRSRRSATPVPSLRQGVAGTMLRP